MVVRTAQDIDGKESNCGPLTVKEPDLPSHTSALECKRCRAYIMGREIKCPGIGGQPLFHLISTDPIQFLLPYISCNLLFKFTGFLVA